MSCLSLALLLLRNKVLKCYLERANGLNKLYRAQIAKNVMRAKRCSSESSFSTFCRLRELKFNTNVYVTLREIKGLNFQYSMWHVL